MLYDKHSEQNYDTDVSEDPDAFIFSAHSQRKVLFKSNLFTRSSHCIFQCLYNAKKKSISHSKFFDCFYHLINDITHAKHCQKSCQYFCLKVQKRNLSAVLISSYNYIQFVDTVFHRSNCRYWSWTFPNRLIRKAHLTAVNFKTQWLDTTEQKINCTE
jgi:hypothetical protein